MPHSGTPSWAAGARQAGQRSSGAAHLPELCQHRQELRFVDDAAVGALALEGDDAGHRLAGLGRRQAVLRAGRCAGVGVAKDTWRFAGEGGGGGQRGTMQLSPPRVTHAPVVFCARVFGMWSSPPPHQHGTHLGVEHLAVEVRVRLAQEGAHPSHVRVLQRWRWRYQTLRYVSSPGAHLGSPHRLPSVHPSPRFALGSSAIGPHMPARHPPPPPPYLDHHHSVKGHPGGGREAFQRGACMRWV